MSAALAFVRRAARALVQIEIILLSLVYLYFVLSDRVPLPAFALLALVWIARRWTHGTFTRRTPFDLPVVLLLLILPVSLWVSTNWWLSLPKVYGVVLGAAFYYATVNAVSTRRDLAWAVFWLVLVCAAIAAAGLVGTDWAQGKIVSASFIYDRLPRFIQGLPRSIAGGFARNGVGGTLALTVPLLGGLYFARQDLFRSVIASSGETHARPGEAAATAWFHWLVIAALVLSLTALALTQSRGGLLGTAAGLVALAVWRERRAAWLIAAGGLGLVLLFALGQGTALIDFVLRMDSKSGTLASRLEVWQRGVWMVQDFPFTGIGIGTYNAVAHSLYPFFIAGPDEVVAHAHNNFLQVAVDLGIPGLLAFVALLTVFAICLWRAYGPADGAARAVIAGLACGMLAHQTFGLTDAFILGTKPGVLLWVFFALSAVLYERRIEWWKGDPRLRSEEVA